MRAGAFHFVEKPFDPEKLLSIVAKALKRVDRIADQQAQANEILQRYRTLTCRELQVLDLLIDGRPSKIIAYELGIITRTVEHHRSAVMKKMDALALPSGADDPGPAANTTISLPNTGMIDASGSCQQSQRVSPWRHARRVPRHPSWLA